VEAMVPDVMRQAMQEKSIDPIDNPDVEILVLERGSPAKLKATITVMPQVTLADITSLQPDLHSHEVTEDMFKRRLEELREPMAEITPVEREARLGDIAIIDVEVEADGEVIASETQKAMEAELKDGVLLPELLAVLPGTFVDETREAKVTFPETYSDPKLAGKNATIRVTVRGVKEKVLPELDDALAKIISNGAHETAESYRQSVRKELEESVRAMERLEREQEVVRALVEASSVEVPQALVDRELTSELESLERSLNRQGLKLDRYFEYLGKPIEQWIAEQRPDAEARLKIDLVLAEFARRESLDPTDEDAIKFLEEQAAKDDELKTQVETLKKSPSAVRYFASRLRRQRVLERLVEVAESQT
ncbi:MAG: trigger factor, partial [Candidatus Dormibacteraeota bacterium]|nr:trigger factor [Candidatus Dormibacteraeota bacterium]